MKERWLPVHGYCGLYEISNLGRVRRRPGTPKCKHGRVIASRIGKRGYPCVNLCCEGIYKTHTVHSLVAAAFIGPRPKGLEVNHLDGDKTNPVPSNLEYVSRKENVAHAFRIGLAPVGERHGISVLTEDLVHEIRRRYLAGETHIQIAHSVCFAVQYIRDVLRGKNWCWLTTPGAESVTQEWQRRFPHERYAHAHHGIDWLELRAALHRRYDAQR